MLMLMFRFGSVCFSVHSSCYFFFSSDSLFYYMFEQWIDDIGKCCILLFHLSLDNQIEMCSMSIARVCCWRRRCCCCSHSMASYAGWCLHKCICECVSSVCNATSLGLSTLALNTPSAHPYQTYMMAIELPTTLRLLNETNLHTSIACFWLFPNGDESTILFHPDDRRWGWERKKGGKMEKKRDILYVYRLHFCVCAIVCVLSAWVIFSFFLSFWWNCSWVFVSCRVCDLCVFVVCICEFIF